MNNLHVGVIIKEVVIQRVDNLTAFANQLGMKRNNLYSIFKRKSVDVDLLFQLSEALNYDFFKIYSTKLDGRISDKVPKKVTIEVILKEEQLHKIIAENYKQ